MQDFEGYLQALQKAVEKQQESSKAIKVAKWIKPLFQTMNIVAPIATNLSPLDPRFSSLILGAITSILSLSSKFLDSQEKLAKMLADMVEKLNSLIDYESIHPGDSKVHKALIGVYGVVLQFCVEASRLFIDDKGRKRGGGKLFVENSWENFEKKFGELRNDFNSRLELFKLTRDARLERDLRSFMGRQESFIEATYHKAFLIGHEVKEEDRRRALEREQRRMAQMS